MLQVIVTIGILVFVLGGLMAISLSRKEGKELKKSCGCAVPGEEGKGGSCVSKCES
jgi:hypothetical protein